MNPAMCVDTHLCLCEELESPQLHRKAQQCPIWEMIIVAITWQQRP